MQTRAVSGNFDVPTEDFERFLAVNQISTPEGYTCLRYGLDEYSILLYGVKNPMLDYRKVIDEGYTVDSIIVNSNEKTYEYGSVSFPIEFLCDGRIVLNAVEPKDAFGSMKRAKEIASGWREVCIECNQDIENVKSFIESYVEPSPVELVNYCQNP